MGNPNLTIMDCKTQADMKRVTGARSICLDVYGEDDLGQKYDLEIQRENYGANPHRARYYTSAMDVENLDAGQAFEELPNTYVIFITEKDFYGAGKPYYLIQNINCTTGKPFDDGIFIMYVNGEYRDGEIGRLMHDFNCTDADDMNYKLMAERTRYLKENLEGVRYMCRIMEEMREEKAADIAKNLLALGTLTYEQIAKATELTLEKIQELADRVAGDFPAAVGKAP